MSLRRQRMRENMNRLVKETAYISSLSNTYQSVIVGGVGGVGVVPRLEISGFIDAVDIDVNQLNYSLKSYIYGNGDIHTAYTNVDDHTPMRVAISTTDGRYYCIDDVLLLHAKLMMKRTVKCTLFSEKNRADWYDVYRTNRKSDDGVDTRHDIWPSGTPLKCSKFVKTLLLIQPATDIIDICQQLENVLEHGPSLRRTACDDDDDADAYLSLYRRLVTLQSYSDIIERMSVVSSNGTTYLYYDAHDGGDNRRSTLGTCEFVELTLSVVTPLLYVFHDVNKERGVGDLYCVSSDKNTYFGVNVKFNVDKSRLTLLQAYEYRYQGFTATLIDNIATSARMFDALVKINFNKLRSILSPWKPSPSNPLFIQQLDILDVSQRRAFIDTMTAITTTRAVHCIHGPPGTGKTTLLIFLLNVICRKHRVMLCAASNKAVLEALTRFRKLAPSVPVCLIAREDVMAEIKDENVLEVYAEAAFRSISTRVNAMLDDMSSLLHKRKTVVEWLSPCIRWISLDVEHYQLLLNTDADVHKIIRKMYVEVYTQLHSMSCKAGAYAANMINESRIVFATCVTSGRSSLEHMLPIDVLMVDEAGQTSIPEVMIPIANFQPKTTVLIGDPKQLPPLITNRVAAQRGLNVSLMERLMAGGVSTDPGGVSMLTIQYRMHPEISLFPNITYYHGDIIDAPVVLDRHHHAPHLGHYLFVDVDGAESGGNVLDDGETSFKNVREADTAIMIVQHLRKFGANDIGVITPYTSQRDYIRSHLDSLTAVNSVDGFQGGEKDYIILSLTRCNDRHDVGFIKNQERLNVSLTRARISCIILGNINTMHVKRNGALYALVHNCISRGVAISRSDLLNKMNTAETSIAIKKPDSGVPPSERPPSIAIKKPVLARNFAIKPVDTPSPSRMRDCSTIDFPTLPSSSSNTHVPPSSSWSRGAVLSSSSSPNRQLIEQQAKSMPFYKPNNKKKNK